MDIMPGIAMQDGDDYTGVGPIATEPYRYDKRVFDTGATRDTDKGKLAFSRFMSPEVLVRYCQYLHKHRTMKDGTTREPDNWKQGIDIDVYLDSLIRHVFDLWLVYNNADPVSEDFESLEDTLSAIMFNTQGYLYEILKATEGSN